MIIPPLNNQRQFHSVSTAVSFHFAVGLFKNIRLKFIILTISTHFNLNRFNVYLMEIILVIFKEDYERKKVVFISLYFFTLYFNMINTSCFSVFSGRLWICSLGCGVL